MTPSSAEAEIWPPARGLDRVAQEVAREWGLTLGERFPRARFSFTAPAGGDLVLKVTPAEDDEADHEPDALASWAGTGAVRLLRSDRARRAMLLERVVPGHDAATLSDAEAISAALAVGRHLWHAVDSGPFRDARAEVRRWLDAAAQTGHRYVPVAGRVFASIDPRERLLVHGDLHHYNLLRRGDEWVAIDPKPLLAEPEFDVVTLLWNPIERVPDPGAVRRKIALLAEGGLDERRIRAWAIVRGTYLGLPIDQGEREEDSRQLAVVRALLGPSDRGSRRPRGAASPR